jgi:transposase
MQENKLKLQHLKIGCVPIIDKIIARMDLRNILNGALKNNDYSDSLLILLKNILIDRDALYAVKDWAGTFNLKLYSGSKINDDRLGRSLDRLFEGDRSTLQTQVVLSMVKTFNLKMEQIHSDTTSITISGSYNNQEPKAVQLKRGHSKAHRPDLKQLVYSLCVSRDGAVPIHFKTYDGNRSDDTIQWDTWSSIRTLLQRPDFIFVGDSKLCVEETMKKIDDEHGLFVTVVPRTRGEVKEFLKALTDGDVRWEQILRKRSRLSGSEFDTFEAAIGPFRLREGFIVFWYRSSQKRKRDLMERNDRIGRAIERLENLNLERIRGPKTEDAIRKRIDAILIRYKVTDWLKVEIKIDTEDDFKALTRGKPSEETRYRRVTKKIPRLHIQRNVEAIACSQLMDGIFPIATNTKGNALEVLKIYKYQPQIEKRHALLKSTFAVAPIWLKKNTRIEALMFVEYLAQTVAALIERELREAMLNQDIKFLQSLPENRASQAPTFDQLLRLFENRNIHELYEKDRLVKLFAEPLSPVQMQILDLLKITEEAYLPKN